MQHHYTIDRLVECLANRQMTPEQQQDVVYRTAQKYNILVHCFNASTITIAVGAAIALFVAAYVGFVIAAVGVFLRLLVEHQLQKYDVPEKIEPTQEPGAPQGETVSPQEQTRIDRFISSAKKTLNVREHEQAKVMQKVAQQQTIEWYRDYVTLEQFVLWKNTILMVPSAEGQKPSVTVTRQKSMAPNSRKTATGS